MSTTTTRLGLVKPATTEDYDVGIVNANSDKIDAAVGITPATSTTRPSTDLFDGRAVHESDTGELAVRRSGAWSLLGTLAATADRLARRGTGGRLKVGTAVDPDDAANKSYVDGKFSDTGWQNLTLEGSWTVGAEGARYRVLNGVCWFHVHATRGSWSSGATLLTFGVDMRLSAGVMRYTSYFDGQAAGELTLNTAGALVVRFAGAVGNAGVVTSGSFPVG